LSQNIVSIFGSTFFQKVDFDSIFF